MTSLKKALIPAASLLLTAMLLLPEGAMLLPAFAEGSDSRATNETLFETSFEENAVGAFLPSKTEEGSVSGVVMGESPMGGGPGIPILYESLEGSPDYVSSENKFNLFDGKNSTKYISSGADIYVSFSTEKSVVIDRYEVSSANDYPGRDPKAWTLYGSSDGKTWQKIDAQSGITFPTRMTTKSFEIGNTVAYKWYKFHVTANGGESLTQFSGLALYEKGDSSDEEKVDLGTPYEFDLPTIRSSGTLSGGEGVLNAFDGNVDSKACIVNTSTLWISGKLKTPAAINMYRIVSANDHDPRDPKDWNFYGSHDGVTWTMLDTRKEADLPDRNTGYSFYFDNTTVYEYYKLDITANNGKDSVGLNVVQLAELQLYVGEKQDVSDTAGPGMKTEIAFGPISTECNQPGAWSGRACLGIYGVQTQNEDTHAKSVIFEGLSIKVGEDTTLSYVIFPGLYNINQYDYEYTSCRVIIDLKFTDGSSLSDLTVKDQNGSVLTPAGQVAGECLYTAQWNYVEANIGAAKGKTIEKILVYFEMDKAEDASKFVTFFDDIKIENKVEEKYEHLSEYINILRGTNNNIAFSRGMCTPGVTVPNGFNFVTPVTDPEAPTLPYTYQQNGDGNPIDSFSVIHAPNFWIGSYGSFQFMPNSSVNTRNGIQNISESALSTQNRESNFSHDNETANAHYYSVVFDEGSPASKVKVEITPTSHAFYVRFTFPDDAANTNVIFDNLWSSGTLKFDDEGKTFQATTNHGKKMLVYGVFDQNPASATVIGGKQGIVSFPQGTRVVTMKVATSFLSSAQAKHNLELEIGSAGFDAIYKSARTAWDDVCGIFEIEGASYTELVSFYSSLYRMYAYPSLYSENEGTNEDPIWVYGSPYKSGIKTSGMMYTNNGFWDTYRTAWAGYALFTPERDTDYLNGMVQHYIETGWMPRWLGPGAVNCMVGTSSDTIFADAYLKGVKFNYEAAWESMLKNASSYSSNMTSGGRKENHTAPYYGYIANNDPVDGSFVQEAYSSSIEGYINDYGLYRMAQAMGMTDEAEYYFNRCISYIHLFNKDADFFMGKSTTGIFSSTASGYNPAKWNGDMYDYTESVGWVNAFPAVFDGEGLTALYGGEEALTRKLDALFDDSMTAMKNVVELASVHHEISEFKEVKMGQYMHNNQPSHHVIFTYAFSSTPYKVQEYTREVLRHVYVGSEIGQGYPGDEDNGEMSAWYVFNALGFYPYSSGSGEYVIGSPLFKKVTVHLENGNDIVIVANNNSQENVYIQSATLNGESFNKMFLTHEQLTSGCEIVFEMGSEPSAWGSDEDSEPTSLTVAGAAPNAPGQDLLVSAKVETAIADSAKLFDNNSLTSATVTKGDSITLDAGAGKVSILTITSASKKNAPTAFTLEVSNDKETWVSVRSETDESWQFNNYIRPFAIPESMRGNYRYYRLTFDAAGTVAEVELLGSAGEGSLDALPSDETDTSTEPPSESPSEEPSLQTSESPADTSSEAPGIDSDSEPSEPTDPRPEDGKDHSVLYIVIAAIAVAVIATAVLFIILRKKK